MNGLPVSAVIRVVRDPRTKPILGCAPPHVGALRSLQTSPDACLTLFCPGANPEANGIACGGSRELRLDGQNSAMGKRRVDWEFSE